MKLSEILNIYKSSDVDQLLKDYLGYNLSEKNLTEERIKSNFKYVGGNNNNAPTIDMLQDGEKGIVERITNAIDAVMEKQKNNKSIVSALNSDKIVEKAFPKYYNNRYKVIHGESDKNNSYDAANQVIVAVNNGSKSSTPTFDIIDKGTGIKGINFDQTILSIHGNNKTKTDKSYLIGTFGQGGSTSLSFANATIIISKYDGVLYFTIVQSVELKNDRHHSYVFLTDNDGSIMTLEQDDISSYDYIKDFFDGDSGTFIRMVDTEITNKFRNNDVNKPRMFGDYLNTELFGVGFPVFLIENRREYLGNEHAQNRHVYGGKLKLLTWKYYRKEYSGHIDIEHKGNHYKIEYYVILPSDANLWGKDSECKAVYNQINVHDKPIIYTVNGQYINGENFTKLKNAGLSFLQYRLLVNIDLDCLGSEKYHFFTTDRSKIKDRELTNGFIEKVIKSLCASENLQKLNEIIAEKSMKSAIDDIAIQQITDEIRDEYLEFLRTSDDILNFQKRNHINPPQPHEIVCYDYIESLYITNTKQKIKKDESLRVIVITNAYKDVNKKTKFYTFLDGKQITPESINYMNGRVQIVVSNLPIGEHDLFVTIYEGTNERTTNIYKFEVVEEKLDDKTKTPRMSINLLLNPIERGTKEWIIDVRRTESAIIVDYCLEHESLDVLFYGLRQAEIEEKRIKLCKPLILFVLLLKENYDNLGDAENKNSMIIAYLKSIIKEM